MPGIMLHGTCTCLMHCVQDLLFYVLSSCQLHSGTAMDAESEPAAEFGEYTHSDGSQLKRSRAADEGVGSREEQV